MYIPSQEMGDYEEMRSKKKPSGILFPLDEEGSYGRPPSQHSKSLPGYARRERKPKVYASYAVSNDCSMHSAKLERNESTRGRKDRQVRGRTPEPAPARKSSVPSRPREPLQKTPKWQNTLRDASYTSSQPRWQDSLRGRDSVSPATPRPQRRPSTVPRKSVTRESVSVSPSRSRNVSMSPERGRQSVSPDIRRRNSSDRGAASSSDWGYTDFSTFTANRKSSSSGTTQRKLSSERRSSSTTERKDSRSSRRSADYPAARKESSGALSRRSPGQEYSSSSVGRKSSGQQEYSGRSYSASKQYSASSSYSYGGVGSSTARETSSSRSSSPTKISLGALKTPTINEWDDMGILGLTSKMFNDSTSFKEGFISSTSSSNSYMRRESVTTKVM